MMSANCSVVVTLSRVSRPWRTKCCSTTCLISTCFNRPCPKRVGMPMHADASSFKQAVMVYPSPLKNSQAHKSSHAQTVAESNSLSPLLSAVGFYVRDQPATHAPPEHQQTISCRPPFFVEMCPRSITPANHFRQLFSGPNQFQMHVLRFLNAPQNSFQTSHVTLGRRGTRHRQGLCRGMQIETVSLEVHQDAHNRPMRLGHECACRFAALHAQHCEHVMYIR